MIFEKVFCHILEKEIFKFNSFEILPNIFIHKKFKKKGSVRLLDSFISSHDNFAKGSKYYDLKNILFKTNRIPLIIYVNGYSIKNETIETTVNIYCFEEDYNLVKEKAAY